MKEAFNEIEDLIADETFQAYVLQSNEEAAAKWEAWGAGDLHRKKLLKDAKELLLSLSLQLSDREIELERRALREKMKANLNQQNREEQDDISKEQSKITALVPLLMMLTILAVGIVLFSQMKAKRSPKTIMIRTSYGEVLTHRLSDGSTVTLNGNSALTFPTRQDQYAVRKLKLEGEAFFNISQKPIAGNKKCEVETSRGIINVMGTQFNVKDRAEDFELLLTEGSINFNSEDQPLLQMMPGEIVKLKKDAVLEKESVDPAMYLAWKNHQMVFEEASIQRLVHRLEYDYGIKVNVENDLLSVQKINIKIDNDDPQELLEALAAIHELELLQVDSKTYTLK